MVLLSMAAAAAAAAAAATAAAAGAPQRLTPAALAAAAAEHDGDASVALEHGGGGNAGDELSVAPSIFERPKDESAEEKGLGNQLSKQLKKRLGPEEALKQLYSAEAGKMQSTAGICSTGSCVHHPLICYGVM